MRKIEDLVEFADNPEPRCACVLLLDVSSSMDGAPIAALNEGLKLFKEEVLKDDLASLRVEVGVIAFSHEVKRVSEFCTVDSFQPPTLTASGSTHTGAAVRDALRMIEERKATYKTAGVPYYRPWIMLITDGEPTGESDAFVDQVARELIDAQTSKRVAFFAIGVAGANMQKLQTFCTPQRGPAKLDGLKFGELFQWLSTSMSRVSQSQVTDAQIALPPPTGWTSV